VKSWGISIHQDTIYVGSVCTNDLTQGAAISRLNGTTFTTLHLISLTMEGEQGNFINGIDQRWNVWEDNYNNLFDGIGTRIDNAQPILSDINFKENGNIMLGFIDRSALQTGYLNYSPNPFDLNNYTNDSAGDFYYICNKNAQYYNEGTVNCPYNPDTFRNQDTEFFIGEEYFYDNIRPVHEEVSLGGIAYQAGSNRLIGTVYNPIDQNRQNTQAFSGITWLDTSLGTKIASKRVVNTANYMGKSGGIGDVEILNTIAPIEIGDRVWFDQNDNGIQDANESGISNVEIKLFKNNNEIAVAHTNPQGTYIFSNDTSKITTSSHIYTISELTADQNYTIVIPNIDGISQQTPLTSLSLARTNVQIGNASNLNDSDALINNSDGYINILSTDLPFAGANNHNFDIGFKTTPISTYTLADHIWTDSNQDGVEDSNESRTNGITINLYGTADCTGNIIATTITSNGGTPAKDGYYAFNNLNAGDYCVDVLLPNNFMPTANANANGQITNINLTANRTDASAVGIYSRNTTVAAVSTDDLNDSCECDAYEEKSIPLYNIYLILFMIIITSVTATYFLRNKN